MFKCKAKCVQNVNKLWHHSEIEPFHIVRSGVNLPYIMWIKTISRFWVISRYIICCNIWWCLSKIWMRYVHTSIQIKSLGFFCLSYISLDIWMLESHFHFTHSTQNVGETSLWRSWYEIRQWLVYWCSWYSVLQIFLIEKYKTKNILINN